MGWRTGWVLPGIIGVLVAGVTADQVARHGGAGRVNLIGPLPGTARLAPAGETGTREGLSFELVADVRRLAIFRPWLERSEATVTITAAPAGRFTTLTVIDAAAVNTDIAMFVRAETVAHPGLAAITPPYFEPGTRPAPTAGTVSATATRLHVLWGDAIVNVVALLGIGLLAAGLVLGVRRMSGRGGDDAAVPVP